MGFFHNNLLAYYKLDEISSNNAIDQTGSYNLTQHNSPGSIGGKIGAARTFDGSSGTLQYLDSTSLKLTDKSTGVVYDSGDSFSISCWFYLTTLQGADVNPIISKADLFSQGEFNIWVNPTATKTKFTLGGVGGITTELASTVTISINNWYHVVCVLDVTGPTAKISVNNETFATTSPTIPQQTTSSFRIGRIMDNYPGNNYLFGYVDEVAIWKNRILTQSEVGELYNSGNGLSFSAFPPIQNSLHIAGSMMSFPGGGNFVRVG